MFVLFCFVLFLNFIIYIFFSFSFLLYFYLFIIYLFLLIYLLFMFYFVFIFLNIIFLYIHLFKKEKKIFCLSVKIYFNPNIGQSIAYCVTILIMLWKSGLKKIIIIIISFKKNK